MDTLMTLALAGFLLGVRHAFDPDHVVAVSAIVSRHPQARRAVAIGALWGLGHTLSLLLVGGAIILFRLSVPSWVAIVLELGVAATLIILGVANLRSRRTAAARPPRPGRPMLIGVMHGLAGSAGVALIVLTAVSEPAWGVAYLLLFAAGTTVGMALITTVVAMPARYAAFRSDGGARWLVVASGVVSVAFGLLLTWAVVGPTHGSWSTASWFGR